jgi:hypothetical protein
VEEKQLVSPPWQRARSHITRCSTIPDFQKHYSDSLPLPPIRLTSTPETFSYFPKWNDGRKGVVFAQLRSPTEKRMRLSTHSHLRTSRDAWNHGKHAGIAVYMPKWTTSKETVETRNYSKKISFMVKFPEFLGSPTYNVIIKSKLYFETRLITWWPRSFLQKFEEIFYNNKTVRLKRSDTTLPTSLT